MRLSRWRLDSKSRHRANCAPHRGSYTHRHSARMWRGTLLAGRALFLPRPAWAALRLRQSSTSTLVVAAARRDTSDRVPQARAGLLPPLPPPPPPSPARRS